MKNCVTMRGRIDPCWLFVYRAPSVLLRPILPEPLELVTFGGMSFVNIVVCKLHGMKPVGCAWPLSLSYWHIAYRLYARFAGDEGLYFLRSDADSALINVAGNLLTSFEFHPARVSVELSAEETNINVFSDNAAAHATVCANEQKRLMPGSRFESLEEASAFLKYKPAALSVEDGRVSIMRITRDEEAWRSRLVQVRQARFEYLDQICPEAEFELCYEVQPIDYVWNAAEALGPRLEARGGVR